MNIKEARELGFDEYPKPLYPKRPIDPHDWSPEDVYGWEEDDDNADDDIDDCEKMEII